MKQFFSLTLTAVFAAILLIGCSDGSALVDADYGSGAEAGTELAALGKGKTAHFVSVGGHDKDGSEDANFSLTAREDAEGNVRGQFSDILKIDGSAVGAVHGDVDCLLVSDNKALVGGVLTKGLNESGPYSVGRRFVVLVEDNGTSANDDPDLISSTYDEQWARFFRAPDFTCDQIGTEQLSMNNNLTPVIGQVVVR